jgi:nucleoside-diphosphate-sugar epimerase
MQGKNKLLLTGATGFLGGAIAASLITRQDWDRVLLLVRAEDARDGMRRVTEVMQRFAVPEEFRERVQAEQILCGDLTSVPRFATDVRLRDVSEVINCAAFASFSNHPAIPLTNIDSTVAFARAVHEAGTVRRFVQVGTAMCCGIQAPTPVPEDHEPGEDAVHLVPYTRSKLEGERRLRQDLPTLPLVVVRPSIIVGHTRLGCLPSPSIFWVFRMARALRQFQCALQSRVDVVPVDYCAEAILELLRKPSLRHDRYHLSAGPGGSSTFGEIDAAMGEALGSGPTLDYEQVDYEKIEARQDDFDAIFGPCIRPLMLRAIKLYGEFAALDIVFENSRIAEEGLALPPSFSKYAGLCALTTQGTPIADQMQYDFKGIRTRHPAPGPRRTGRKLDISEECL